MTPKSTGRAYRQPKLHYGMQMLVRDLNHLYRDTPALYAKDCDPEGFQWIEANDVQNSVFAWIRRGNPGDLEVVVVCNFTGRSVSAIASASRRPGFGARR